LPEEKLWQAIGRMVPWGRRFATTQGDGRFAIEVHPRAGALIALDEGAGRGAMIVLDPKGNHAPVEARLQPLVRIFGRVRLEGQEKPLERGVVSLNLPYDENDPLCVRRVGICITNKCGFEFRVPPGCFALGASDGLASAHTVQDRVFTVRGDEKELDMGTLVLGPLVTLQDRIARARAQGTWGNLKTLYGHPPPRWHITDARGVRRNAEPADFQGKWVLLYFWSPDCAPCLGKQLPELVAFYERRKTQRNRFEILAFCCDFSESLKTMDDLDRHLAAVKKNVWGGKELPFPVLLDNTFQTYERFGLVDKGVFTNFVLIDPDGNLVEGGLETLARTLGPP
jgi:hypothetical protein